MSNFLQKVSSLQTELKAPKGQLNKFGGYRYRSCEDILEAAKPLLAKHKLVLTVSDDVVLIGDRFYVKATAQLMDVETGDAIGNTAYAREAAMKKGMDDSQVTGTASSYARKYALNGLLCIDDTKDADTDEYAQQQQPKEPKPQPQPQPAQAEQPVEQTPKATRKFVCAECGQEITDYKGRNTQLKASDIAAMSYQKFGKTLCMSCSKALAKKEES